MNVPHPLTLRFPRMRRAYTGQSPPTLCPGACTNVRHARACSCCLSRRRPSHSAPAATATPSSATSRESPSTATMSTATVGFLACFINHESTTVDVQTVKFSNGSGHVITGAKLDEAESTRPASLPVSNNSCGDCLVAFFTEQLEQTFVRHAIR